MTEPSTEKRKFRVELRIIVREIWEVEAADEIEAEFHYMENPDAFIFDREETETTVTKVYEA